jgi:hypothetical protein
MTVYNCNARLGASFKTRNAMPLVNLFLRDGIFWFLAVVGSSVIQGLIPRAYDILIQRLTPTNYHLGGCTANSHRSADHVRNLFRSSFLPDHPTPQTVHRVRTSFFCPLSRLTLRTVSTP